MFLNAISSAFPGRPYTQPEVWDLLCNSVAMEGVGRRGRKILETVLMGHSGVGHRHFAIAPQDVVTMNAQQLNEAFEREAPKLAAQALVPALEAAGVPASALDAMFVCTCTGYLCPGVSSHLAEQLGMRPDILLHDVTGLGCGAAIPTLHAAKCLLLERPQALIAMVAVEICSAAFFLCDDSGVAVSACLFGDGASASIWRGEGAANQWRADHFRSLHLPAHREKIRFVNDGGRLRNKLDRSVPEVASSAVEALFAKRTTDPDAIIAHTGGRDVIDAIEARLPAYPLIETRRALSRYGNLSSPSVMVSLEDRIRTHDDRRLWLAGFGSGFSAHTCELIKE